MAAEIFTYTAPELGAVVNVGKDMMLDQLVREGFLSRDQANTAKRRFFVVVQKKSWLSSIFSSKKEDGWNYVMAKTDTDLDTGKTLDDFKSEK